MRSPVNPEIPILLAGGGGTDLMRPSETRDPAIPLTLLLFLPLPSSTLNLLSVIPFLYSPFFSLISTFLPLRLFLSPDILLRFLPTYHHVALGRGHAHRARI